MVNVDGLSRQIRGIRDVLEALEHQVREAGEQAKGLLHPVPHPVLRDEWKNMVEAAANLALAADELLHPTVRD